MPSRAELRISVERVLRAVAIGALAILLWQSVRVGPSLADAGIVTRGLAGLQQFTLRASVPPTIRFDLDSMPSRLQRDWLRALAGAGSRVTWGGNLPATMIAAQPIASPTGGERVRVAAPAGAGMVIRDEAGVLDSTRSGDAGASLIVPFGTTHFAVRVGQTNASTIVRESVSLHRVLVMGTAGWESKFVVTALEEAGWKVDAFVPVAPGVDVTQGSATPIDTIRYSAIVALDGAAAPYADRIDAFVRTGGGVVLAPAAAELAAIEPVRAATGVSRATSEARAIEASGSVTLSTLALAPMMNLRSDAIPLEKRGDAVGVAARRVGAGRVIQIAYEDTWRWRMGGAGNAVRDHRAWWSGLVSSVAYAPRITFPDRSVRTDESPIADLVAAVGPATSRGGVANVGRNQSHWAGWLFILLSIALVSEIVSRRLRGAR
jgi:hypothetical protein